MVSNNYIVAAGERAAADYAARNCAKVPRAQDWIGESASWSERRLFDFSVIAAEARRNITLYGDGYSFDEILKLAEREISAHMKPETRS